MPQRLGGDGRPGEPAGLKLLLVSKDALFSHVARAKLESWGHSVHLEDDEAAAVEWFRIEPIRLAIIDFDMPDGAGERLCRQLRQSDRPGYVYLMCYGSGTDKERTIMALESGADSYTHKPLHPGELRLRLEHASRLLSLDSALFQGNGTDLATGMISRNAFDRFLGILFAQCQRSGGSGVLMFVEVTNRTDIYRRHGFLATYSVELEIAKRISAIHRASDFVARVDEGRFCLLLTNTTSLQAHTVALRLGDLLTDVTVRLDDILLSPRLAISMVDFPASAQSSHEAMEHAPRTTVAVLGSPEGPDDTVPTAI